jgi:hypothetical protein
MVTNSVTMTITAKTDLSPKKWQADGKHTFPCVAQNQHKCLVIKYVPGGIRTPNLLIRSQKLYPVELQAL